MFVIWYKSGLKLGHSVVDCVDMAREVWDTLDSFGFHMLCGRP